MYNMNAILKELKLHDKNDNSTLSNLTKPPLKEPKSQMPHTFAPQKYATQQLDLLQLPDDDGYKYLLVVVDIATRLCDAEPLKTKDSNEVKKAMLKIWKRKYIKKPLRFEVDSGSEFKGEFKKYFEKILDFVVKKAGRHRQQSVVETKNGQIGKILNMRMLAEEINNNEVSKNWVDLVPKVIALLNKHLSYEANDINPELPIITNNYTSLMLPIGSKVRIKLDTPKSYLDDKKLYGKFRMGDIRWSKELYTITNYYLRPNQPPMYQLNNDKTVAYTKYELQLVKDDEKKPNTFSQKKVLVDELLERFKKGNRVFFRVKWNDGDITEEPRTNLIVDVPQLVKDFENTF